LNQIVFTPKDRKQIKRMGISESQIFQQLKMFVKGSSYCQLLRPAKINDGIKKFSKKEMNNFISSFENSLETKKNHKIYPCFWSSNPDV